MPSSLDGPDLIMVMVAVSVLWLWVTVGQRQSDSSRLLTRLKSTEVESWFEWLPEVRGSVA